MTYNPSEIFPYTKGVKLLELSNHLGNVLAVVSDKISAVSGSAVAFSAEVVHATDYYPFGMGMPDRQDVGGYRYGFQNQEEDKELWSGAVSYKYRIEDPRLGRFFSVDPLAAKYPQNSVYAFSENQIINSRELEGLEKIEYIYTLNPSTAQLEFTSYTETQVWVDGIPQLPLEKSYSINGRNTTEKTIVEWGDNNRHSALSNMGMNKLVDDFNRYGGKFPENYYEELGSYLIESAYELNKQSGMNTAAAMWNAFQQVFALTNNKTGFNNGDGAQLFHFIESLTRANDDTGYDKLLHFISSAEITYCGGGEVVANVLGVAKEFFNDEVNSWFTDDNGWDDNDMKANQKGQSFAKRMSEKIFGNKQSSSQNDSNTKEFEVEWGE